MKKLIIGIIIGVSITYLSLVARLYWLDSQYDYKGYTMVDYTRLENCHLDSFSYSNSEDSTQINYWRFFPSDRFAGSVCTR